MLKGSRRSGTPFYTDFWFWVKALIFAVFLIFLVYPFSTLIINSFLSTKATGFTLYNFNRFFAKKYYYSALLNHVPTPHRHGFNRNRLAFRILNDRI